MGIEFVALISGSGLFVSMVAIVLMWRKPADVPDMYLRRLAVIEATLDTTQQNLEATRIDLAQTKKDLADYIVRYNILYQDNLRLRETITWLRVQLREHGIEIARLPEELRDPHAVENTAAYDSRRAVLLKKIEELGRQEAIASGGAEKFKLQQELLAAKQELRELDRGQL